MKDENDNIDVTREGERMNGGEGEDITKFKTIKQFKNDLKGFYKPPQTLWGESFIGEAIADECHPENSSFAIGAFGGFATGVGTGFFSASRVPLPIRTPIPSPFLPKIQVLIRNSIIGSSVLWRISKRTLLGTILFAVLECDFKDLIKRPSEKWKGSIAAGAVSGAVFGLRGGLPGMVLGVALFSSLPAGWELYGKREQIKLG